MAVNRASCIHSTRSYNSNPSPNPHISCIYMVYVTWSHSQKVPFNVGGTHTFLESGHKTTWKWQNKLTGAYHYYGSLPRPNITGEAWSCSVLYGGADSIIMVYTGLKYIHMQQTEPSSYQLICTGGISPLQPWCATTTIKTFMVLELLHTLYILYKCSLVQGYSSTAWTLVSYVSEQSIYPEPITLYFQD